MQSRYYNPEWGRFINADAIVGVTGDLLGHNMFAYCQNNPVNFEDLSGYFLCTITCALVGGVIGGVSAAIQGKDIRSGIVSGAVSGAMVGAAADIVAATGGTGLIAIGMFAGAGAIGGASGNVIDQVGNKLVKGLSLKDSVTTIDGKSVIKSAAIGTIAGAVTGGTSVVLGGAMNTSKTLYISTIMDGSNPQVVESVSKAVITSATRSYFVDTAAGGIYTTSSTLIDYISSQ